MNCSDPTIFLSRLLNPLIGLVTEAFLDNEQVHTVVCDLIINVITNCKNFQIFPVLRQLIELLLELLENSFKTVKAKVCICLNSLTKVVPVELQYFTKEILECLVHCLKHPDFNVRLTSLEALGSFGFIFSDSNFEFMFDYILGKKTDSCFRVLEFSQENILSNVLRDEDSEVRKKFFSVVCEWLTLLPYKVKLKEKLVPFLLMGLFDPVLDVRDFCMELVVGVGAANEQGEKLGTETDPGLEGVYPWHPFENRPRFGVKQYFLGYFLEVCPCLLLELNNFMPGYRETAAKMLFALMVLTEHVQEENAETIIMGLMSGINPNELENTQKTIFQCFELAGRFISARLYMWILSKAKVKTPMYCMFLCIPTKTVPINSQLVALSHLIKGSLGKQQDSDLEQCLPKILKFVRKFERSKFSLQICSILIESSTPMFSSPSTSTPSSQNSKSFNDLCKTEIFSLLVEHEHESIGKLVKTVQEMWYQLDLTHFNSTIQALMLRISSVSSSEWRTSNNNVISK